MFRRIGYSEKAGSGGPRILDIIEKYHLQEPEFTLKDNYTTVRFYKMDEGVDSKAIEEHLSGDHYLSENEQKIVDYLIKNPIITRKIAIEKLDMTEYYYQSARKGLLQKQIIVPSEQRGKLQSYRLRESQE